ncbi:MAG: alkaline phosphatase family protein [Alphaproteobacteria bacterium]
MGRVLAIGLDGYSEELFDEMMASGDLPNLAALRDQSARVRLDHGPAQRSGLGWEQISTGLSPDDSGHHTAVHFHTDSYRVTHESARNAPFPASMKARTVVFDVPYFDLARAANVEGVVCWGSHDPGIPPLSRPAGVFAELDQRVGEYSAPDWTYGFAWPSEDRCRQMGGALVKAVEQRCDAALWLFDERLPDWELGILVVGELHGAFEGLWHGIDPEHPLASVASAEAAKQALRDIICAADTLVGRLREAFPDASIVCFTPHGMGRNTSDVSSMVLLPELMCRSEAGKTLLPAGVPNREIADGIPLLKADESWAPAVRIPAGRRVRMATRQMAKRVLGAESRRLTHRARDAVVDRLTGTSGRPLDWMVATRYIPYWSRMRAFALPSFYDGRIRINLKGREARGLVEPNDYEEELNRVISLVEKCRDARTGQPVIGEIERPAHDDPRDLDPTEADLTFVWKGASLAFEHPDVGMIGPLPFRRTGGHTGGHGFAWFNGNGFVTGDHGTSSVFDLVPTVIESLGETVPDGLSGSSFDAVLRGPAGEI